MEVLSRLEAVIKSKQVSLAVDGLQAPSDQSLFGFGKLCGTFYGMQLALEEISEIRKGLDKEGDEL